MQSGSALQGPSAASPVRTVRHLPHPGLSPLGSSAFPPPMSCGSTGAQPPGVMSPHSAIYRAETHFAGQPTRAQTDGASPIPPAPAPWGAEPSNPAGTGTVGPGDASGYQDDIEREEAQLRRKNFRIWWSNRDRRTLGVLAGAPPGPLMRSRLRTYSKTPRTLRGTSARCCCPWVTSMS